ncbi:hypothetical protein [Mycolicibacterium canariasense]|nr:hypothetical protein [Mycolicibacterium canariasense]MCV7212198.1 hypothetical protein [Mycolicibacterium canariasense]
MATAVFLAGMVTGVALLRIIVHIDRAGEQTLDRMRAQWEAGRRDQRIRTLRTSSR